MNLFLLPGNPPAKSFYRSFALEIHEQDPHVQVGIADYPLLSETRDSLSYFKALTREVGQQFLNFRDSHSGPAALVGHSLGGYLALKVLQDRPDRVDRCYLMHPFLRRPAPVGRALLKVAHLAKRIRSLDKGLVAIQPLIGRIAPSALQLTASEIKVFLQLAYHEHQAIAQDRSPFELPQDLQKKVRVYSTPGDIWCPPSTVAALGPDIYHESGTASHSFIISKKDRALAYAFIRADTQKHGNLEI